MPATQGIHFVGSLGMGDVETAFRRLAGTIGGRAKRYPDGEPGERANWIRFQIGMLQRHPDVTLVGTENSAFGGLKNADRPYFGPVQGVEIEDIEFGALGYAEEAVKSYEIFARLRSEGVIPAGTRFQVCLPTPAAVLTGFIYPELQAAFEPAYERAMLAEAAAVIAAIPADDLAIQWDIASEVIAAAGGPPVYYDNVIGATVERVCRLVNPIPETVEVGIHLCYGDPGHKHVIEPTDLAISVDFANTISQGAARSLQWMHMPVPRDRQDDAYFAPLADLKLAPETDLFLGLVHHTGGLEATQARQATANKFARAYGVATECGLGRRAPETLTELLEIHIAALAA